MLLWRQETETLQLQPAQLQFLLDDLVRKLDRVLLATAGKRRCFLKVVKNKNCSFFSYTQLDNLTPNWYSITVVFLLFKCS